MKQTECQDFLLNHLGENYKEINIRRRKAYYNMYYSVIVIGLVALLYSDDGSINILGFSLAHYYVVILGPSVLLVLYNNYLYLAAHTLIAYTTYFRTVLEVTEKELEPSGFSAKTVIQRLTQRDITSVINFFQFPLKDSDELKDSLKGIPRWVARVLINLVVLLSILIPIGIYAYYLFLFSKLDIYYDTIFGKLLFALYLTMGLSFILTPIYFILRVRTFKTEFNQMVRT